MNHECIANYAIHCTVKDCRYHKGDENYCSLDTVNISSRENNPTDQHCVDCCSFKCRNHSVNG